MRLIDADKIRDYVKEQINPYGKPFEGSVYEFGLKIMNYINNMSVDYDIYKVVEKLEERARTVNVIAYGNIYEAINKDVAIEIVKHGGVSDDVCEWKLVSDGEFIKNPHTKRLYSNEQSMKNVYCNTCGKKIKVVE